MLVIGDKEASVDAVSVRHRREGDLGTMTFDKFISHIETEIAEKK